MKGFIVFAGLLALASSAAVSKGSDKAEVESDDSVLFHYYNRKNPDNGTLISAGKIETLRKAAFDVTKETLFIVHGWKGDNDSDFTNNIREKILSLKDINVFVVDWSPFSDKDYIAAKRSVVSVGQDVADIINEIKNKFGLKLSQVKFVGWSLGAHVSGNAGAALGGKVDRITGLDPAGPLFDAKTIDDRLDPTDAQFVQVIHTSKTLGINMASGHADYYPNGGSNQPGTFPDILGGKSHSRVFSLYVESLDSDKFVATKCDNWNNYKKNKCNGNEKSVMGGFVPDYSARGTYYLSTNSKSPFAQG